MLAFILHHANRYSKDKEFYAIKDRILKKYGVSDGYDIQHIPGKRCWSCGGTGRHYYYSNTYPYKAYDSTDCYHCNWGWYKLPQWICLERKRFGKFTFHRPLKREFYVKNPWTAEGMGFEVSNRPVIESYIEHEYHWFSRWACLILFLFYDRKFALHFWKHEIHLTPQFIFRLKWRYQRWKNRHHVSHVYTPVYDYEELPF